MEDGDGKDYAYRIPDRSDACIHCKNVSKRRYSSETPSVTKCSLGCEKYVYEIHDSCVDCAEKFNQCPWCGRTPWEKLPVK
jgi:hypothetical protein